MMKWLSVVLPLAGVSMGVWAVAASNRRPPDLAPDRPPAVNPYARGVAATGVVEGAGGNVRVAAPEAGVVTQVFVQANDEVKAGDALFQLDAAPLAAELARAEASVEVARRRYERLQAPRQPELRIHWIKWRHLFHAACCSAIPTKPWPG